MKKIIETLKRKWNAETPKFYKWVRNVSATISGCAIAIKTAMDGAGCTMSDTWTKIYAYVISITAAIAFLSQFAEKKTDVKDSFVGS